jgi:hypothetical protein
MAGFAGGSVVLVVSFSQNFCIKCKSFVKKNEIFRVQEMLAHSASIS